MIKESLLKQVLVEQKELLKPSPDYVERELLSKISSLNKLKHIVVITGHRRSGKSVFLSQIINKYYGLDNIYYLNLDDERLASLSLKDMNTVMEIFTLLFGKKRVIFLDEIQNLEGWERFVSRLYNEGYKIFVTGSNARLLSSELATFLTGRHIDIELYPFSFREFLAYKKSKLSDTKAFYRAEIRAKIRKFFDEYLRTGGFPEVVRYKKMALLRTMFSDVITKDVVGRYKVREVKTIREIAHFLISQAASEFSYNRIKNIYSLGSVHTAKNYIEYLVSTYMFIELSRFSYSLKEVQTRIKKIYVVDNGLVRAMGFSPSQAVGKLYENLVLSELKRRGKEVYYYKDKRGREIDFVIRENQKVSQCLQVCFDYEDEATLKREINSLLAGLSEFRLKKGLILTSNNEDEFEINGKKIVFTPVWKWLLEVEI